MLQVEKQRTHKFELVTHEYLEDQLRRALERRSLPGYAPFLDDDGVRNWMAAEYAERLTVVADPAVFLKNSLPYLIEHFIPELSLVSIGVGNGRKERLLLESLLRIGSPSYYSIDISSPMIDAALNTVADINVEKTALVAFFQDLPILNRLWCHPSLLCLLGNTFSTYGAEYVLSAVRAELEPNDLFLFDCRLSSRDAPGIEQIISSPARVRFQIAPLIKRGLEPSAAEYVVTVVSAPTPDGPARRVDLSLRLLRQTVVNFATGPVVIDAGESIRLGSTWQYTAAQVRCFIHRSGLSIVEQHVAPTQDTALFMLRSPREKTNLLR